MKQEDKELLLRDLCGRLPYGVACKDIYINVSGRLDEISTRYNMCRLSDIYGELETCYISNCRPYLFPLSSMTEEQKEEFDRLYTYDALIVEPQWKLIDFCNKHHLDYRGLIPKGLASDATGLNIY